MLRSSHRRDFIKILFSKNLQNSQENTCVGVSFLTLLKRDSNIDESQNHRIEQNRTEHLQMALFECFKMIQVM